MTVVTTTSLWFVTSTSPWFEGTVISDCSVQYLTLVSHVIIIKGRTGGAGGAVGMGRVTDAAGNR